MEHPLKRSHSNSFDEQPTKKMKLEDSSDDAGLINFGEPVWIYILSFLKEDPISLKNARLICKSFRCFIFHFWKPSVSMNKLNEYLEKYSSCESSKLPIPLVSINICDSGKLNPKFKDMFSSLREFSCSNFENIDSLPSSLILLSLPKNSLLKEDFTKLPPNLQGLDLSQSSVKDEDLINLPKGLKELNLCLCSQITGECFANLPPSLTYLNVNGCSNTIKPYFKDLNGNLKLHFNWHLITPFFACVDSLSNVKHFLENGVDVNQTNLFEENALHFVKNEEVARFLISKGIEINKTRYDNKTPLAVASEPLKELLIKNGAI